MSRSSWKRFTAPTLGLVGLGALVAAGACFEAPVEKPAPKTFQETSVKVEQNIKNQVDLLFVIDDSPSMSPKQAELKARFPELIKILDDFGKANPAWYHIGVITTDMGAGQFTLGSGQCRPGGKGGKLQALGAGAEAGCAPPTRGLNFIDYNQLKKDAGGAPDSNLPAGQSLEKTFGCMASVGDKGCGFEQPLGAVYAALHDKPAENHDFFREGALLVVVFVSDEDDCSIDTNSDLFDPAKVSQYGALLSYRCTQYGIQCVDPSDGQKKLLPYGDSAGSWGQCEGAGPNAGGKLTDIQKFVNFFRSPAAQGGVKVDPNDVILVGITAPADQGASSLLANPNPTPPGPYMSCPGPVDGRTCAVVLQHSCIAPSNNEFFGDPAVRINQVIGSVKNKQQTSICDTSYQSALQNLGQLIVSNIGAGCIEAPFADPSNPDCLVEDVTQTTNGQTVTQIPRCDQAGGTIPCWKLESKPLCSPADQMAGACKPGTCKVAVCPKAGEGAQHFGVTIDRGPNGQPPPNTTARVACSTISVPRDPTTGMLPACGAPLP